MSKSRSKSAKSSAERKPGDTARQAATAVQPEGPADSGNFIQFGQAEAGKRPVQNTLRSGGQPSRKADAAAKLSEPSGQALRVPDAVQERFIHIGDKFHFPDGTEAFTHQGNRLTTRSENAVVIQAMVAIAREQGPGPVTVGGTEFFRKEAWFAANLAGLKVRGYEPTEFERERLARAVAARRGPATTDATPVSANPRERSPPGTERATDRRSPGSRLIVGRLVDHGAAPYEHDPKQAMSYFVRIETERGDREIWGVDLERAFRHSLSTPGIGDVVGLRAIGKEAVTVVAAKTDEEGRQIGTEPLDTHRNQWIVERKSFLDERRKMADVLRDPTLSATEAIRQHPELEGSYLQLQMGSALADERFRSTEQREQFVEHLRAHLAQRIEFGQPLEPVHLRANEDRAASPRSPDRDYHPTR